MLTSGCCYGLTDEQRRAQADAYTPDAISAGLVRFRRPDPCPLHHAFGPYDGTKIEDWEDE